MKQSAANGQVNRSASLLQGQLEVPHGLVIDDCKEALYVADRESAAVHRFRFASERLPAPSDADAKNRLRSQRRRRTLLGQPSAAERAAAAGVAGPADAAGRHIAGTRAQRRRLILQEQAASAAGADAAADPALGTAEAASGDSGSADGDAADSGEAEAGAADSDTNAVEDSDAAADAAAADADGDAGGEPVQSATMQPADLLVPAAVGPEATADLRDYGPVYGLTAGPYGSLLALCWQREANRVLLLLLSFGYGALLGHMVCNVVIFQIPAGAAFSLFDECGLLDVGCSPAHRQLSVCGNPPVLTALHVTSCHSFAAAQPAPRWSASGRCPASRLRTTWR